MVLEVNWAHLVLQEAGEGVDSWAWVGTSSRGANSSLQADSPWLAEWTLASALEVAASQAWNFLVELSLVLWMMCLKCCLQVCTWTLDLRCSIQKQEHFPNFVSCPRSKCLPKDLPDL